MSHIRYAFFAIIKVATRFPFNAIEVVYYFLIILVMVPVPLSHLLPFLFVPICHTNATENWKSADSLIHAITGQIPNTLYQYKF